jgi:hypothetical protein
MRQPGGGRGSARHSATEAELDERLTAVFNDRRTPAAPEALYVYVREVPMNEPSESSAGLWMRLRQLLRRPRRAALAAAAVLILVVAFWGTVALPRVTGPGASPTAANPVPTLPSPPTGWQLAMGYGSEGSRAGANLPNPASRIALHVVCRGPDEVVVFAGVGSGYPQFGVPLQSVVFQCGMDGATDWVELTSTNGAFQQVSAAVIPGLGSLVNTSYYVSVEVPAESPAPSPSPSR